MKKPPAFQVYARDEITDYPGITAAARGVFLLLRCRCWLKGSLPANADELARLALVSRREFARVWPEIRAYFQKRRSSYVCPSLKEQRARQIANRIGKQHNGQLGALVRWGPRPIESKYNPRVILVVVDGAFFKLMEGGKPQPTRDELFKAATRDLLHYKILHTAALVDEAISVVYKQWQKRQGT